MRVFGVDSETDRFRDGVMAPEAVCFQFCEGFPATGAIGTGEVLLSTEGLVRLVGLLRDPDVLIVGAEISYDVLVSITTIDNDARARDATGLDGHGLLALWVAAYDANRVTDVLIRQKLIDLARGCYRYERDDSGGVIGVNSYGLDDVTWRHCRIKLNKDNPWRIRYSELRGVPVAQWPQDAYQYASDDGSATVASYLAQWRPSLRIDQNYPGWGPAEALRDEFNQARAALWLKAMSVYGLRTDPVAIESFERYIRAQFARISAELVQVGIVRREYKRDRAGIERYIAALGQTHVFANGPSGLSFAAKNYDAAIVATGDTCLARLKAGALADPELVARGLVVVKDVKDTKAATERMLAVVRDPPRNDPSKTAIEKAKASGITPLGNVKLDKDTCLNTGDPVLMSFAEYSHLGKQISTDLKWLKRGDTLPIHSHFEPLLETGRTSSSSPNVQNQARGGKIKCPACHGDAAVQQWCEHCGRTGKITSAGARECFVPRQGWVLIDSDYGMLELHTLAQTCYWVLGYSTLGDALRRDIDPHTQVAAQILGITYAQGKARKNADPKDLEFDDVRNAAKAVNFGRPGGLGAKTLKVYAAKSYNVFKEESEWQTIIDTWNDTWLEMPAYFRMVNSLESWNGRFNVVQPWSGRLRAGAPYCSACNSFYQGLGADVAKLAGWFIFKACYIDKASPLYGSRPVNFVHDQFLVEVREDGNEAAAANEVGRLMNLAGAIVLPDVPVKCEPILARRWSKFAKKTLGETGELTAWEDLRLFNLGVA